MMLDEDQDPQDPPPPPGFVPVEQGASAQGPQDPPPPAGFEPVGGGDKVSDLTLTDLVTGKKPYTDDPAVANFKRDHPWIAPGVSLAQGVGAGIFGTLHGLDQLGTKGWAAISGQPEQPNIIPEKWTQAPPDFFGKAGKFAEQAGEFLLPASKITKAGEVIDASTKLPWLAKVGAKAAALEAPAAGAVSYVQSGGDTSEAAKSAAMAGGTAAVLPIIGKVLGHYYGALTGAGNVPVERAATQATPELMAAMKGDITEKEILEATRQAVSNVAQSRSADYVNQLRKLPSNITVDLRPARRATNDLLNSFRVRRILNPNTNKVELDFANSPLWSDNAAQERMRQLFDKMVSPMANDPLSVDSLKRGVDAMYSDSGADRAFVEGIRNTLAETLNKQVPGYQKMTSDYAKASDFLDNLADLSTQANNDGTAIRKLAGSLKQNNNYRETLLEELSKYTNRDLTGMIAGNRLSSPYPRGIVGALHAAGVGLGGGAFLHYAAQDPAALAVSLVSLFGMSPRVVGEAAARAQLATRFGKAGAAAIPGQLRSTPSQVRVTGQQPNYDQNAEKNLSDYYGAIGSKAHGGKVNYADGDLVQDDGNSYDPAAIDSSASDDEILRKIQRERLQLHGQGPIQLNPSPGQFRHPVTGPIQLGPNAGQFTDPRLANAPAYQVDPEKIHLGQTPGQLRPALPQPSSRYQTNPDVEVNQPAPERVEQVPVDLRDLGIGAQNSLVGLTDMLMKPAESLYGGNVASGVPLSEAAREQYGTSPEEMAARQGLGHWGAQLIGGLPGMAVKYGLATAAGGGSGLLGEAAGAFTADMLGNSGRDSTPQQALTEGAISAATAVLLHTGFAGLGADVGQAHADISRAAAALRDRMPSKEAFEAAAAAAREQLRARGAFEPGMTSFSGAGGLDNLNAAATLLGAQLGVGGHKAAELATAAGRQMKHLVKEGTLIPKEEVPIGAPAAQASTDLLQRVEEPGVDRATFDKPHGIYTTPAGMESPHADLGGDTFYWKKNPAAAVLRIPETNDPSVWVRQGARSAGAGVWALRELVGPDDFAAMKAMSHNDLAKLASDRFPGVDWTRYYDKQEIMEGLGGMVAKEKGYHAIELTGKNPQDTEFVGLTPESMTPTNAPGERQAPSNVSVTSNDPTLDLQNSAIPLGAQLGSGEHATGMAAYAREIQIKDHLEQDRNQNLTPQELDNFAKVAKDNPEIGAVAPFMNSLEVKKALANPEQVEAMTRMLRVLPESEKMSAMMVAGLPKLGWYRGSAQAISDVFQADAPRFAQLLAATSPRISVEVNLRNALNIWKNWVAEGRPQDPQDILRIMAKSVEGKGTEKSVLDAWRNNTYAALTSKDPMSLTLSGPKVNSFQYNLRDHVFHVTNDAWMANAFDVAQNMFQGRNADTAAGNPGMTPEYAGTSARIRQAAAKVGMFPSQGQETIWSVAMQLYELARKNGISPREVLQKQLITPKEINATPDFSTLFAKHPEYLQILDEAGYGDAARALKPFTFPGAHQDVSSMPLSQQNLLMESAGTIGDVLDMRGRESLSKKFAPGKGWTADKIPKATSKSAAQLEIRDRLMDSLYPKKATGFTNYEEIPGASTSHLPDIAKLPDTGREHFTTTMHEPKMDYQGKDIIQTAVGPPTIPTRSGQGSYVNARGRARLEAGLPLRTQDIESQPARVMGYEAPLTWKPAVGEPPSAMPDVGPRPRLDEPAMAGLRAAMPFVGPWRPDIDPQIRANIEGGMAAHGMIGAQEGVGGNIFVPSPPEARTGLAQEWPNLHIPLEEPANEFRMRKLTRQYPNYAFATTGPDIHVLGLDAMIPKAEADNMLKILQGKSYVPADSVGFYVDFANEWAQKPGSRQVTSKFFRYADAMSPDAYAKLDQKIRQMAGDTQTNYRAYSNRKNTPAREDLMNLLGIVHKGGLDALRVALKNGEFLPGLAAGAVLLPHLLSSSANQDERSRVQ